jgi:LCP family protein required for cell wall assembly
VTHLRRERPSDPRSAAAALLSFLFPGFGQAYNRQYLLAGLLAAPVVLLVIVGALAVLGQGSFLSRLLDTGILIGLIVLDVALLGWRLVAILQAHGSRSPFTFRTWPTWLTGVLVMLTLAMHAVPAYYATKAIDTLESVSLEGGGGLFDRREGRDVTISPPSFQPEVQRGERVTVLLVGMDYAPGRTTHLTDTMLVATLDSATSEGAMVSVPRDLYGVPLPDGTLYNAKLNSLMSVAGADPANYPLGGPGTLKAAIGELLGTRIHYFAAIDLAGLRDVIDTVGGIDVTVDRTVNDPLFQDPFTNTTGFYLEAGFHHMDGATALAYVRSRMGEGDSDFTRAERQQQVLTAIAEKLTSGNLLVTLPGLLDAIRDNLATDIPSARISELAAEGQDADLNGLDRVVLAPPQYVTPEPFSAAGYILHPELDAIRRLADRIFGS